MVTWTKACHSGGRRGGHRCGQGRGTVIGGGGHRIDEYVA